MRTVIFDLETFTLYADTGILLCCVLKEFGSHAPIIIRADQFKNWKNNRADVTPMVKAVSEALNEDYDIYVAHNGVYFDRPLLTSWAIKYNLPILFSASKFIDPCQLLRRKMRLTRNSLASAIEFLDIPEKKTPIRWNDWKLAAFNGDSDALDRVVKHCVQDVKSLELVYNKMRRLVKGIDTEGSMR